jgi:hypothetical protein
MPGFEIKVILAFGKSSMQSIEKYCTVTCPFFLLKMTYIVCMSLHHQHPSPDTRSCWFHLNVGVRLEIESPVTLSLAF